MRLYRYSDPEPTTICSGETERPRRRYRVPAMASRSSGTPLWGTGRRRSGPRWDSTCRISLAQTEKGKSSVLPPPPRRSIIQGCPGGGASVRMGGGDRGRRAGSSWETK